MPINLSREAGGENKIISQFWDREYEKCKYVQERKAQIQLDFEEKQKAERIRLANEAKDEPNPEQEKEEMDAENERYMDMLYMTKAKLGMISQEELDEIMKKRGKKK